MISKVIRTAICCSFVTTVGAFVVRPPNTKVVAPSQSQCAGRVSETVRFARTRSVQDSYLLQEFCISSGEVINPYEVLKVSRQADRPQIRDSYVTLSRRYHPDSMRHRTILPGSCNSMEEVRTHWERIKLSYEILKDPQTRRKYDRHEALSDPGEALRRAAVDAAFQGVTNIGKGIFNIGASAFAAVGKKENQS